MSDRQPTLSEFKGMWLFVLFDLPVTTREKRRDYTRFRKDLITNGFSMLQYSVYARYYRSEEAATPMRRHLEVIVPPDGQVRLLLVTDHQFGKMQVFLGKFAQPTEEAPKQLMLF
jgi:CRISPR-associated protein Cas2